MKPKKKLRKKNLVLRVIVIIIAAALVIGLLMPVFGIYAAEDSIEINSFETGKLDQAIREAADGTDYNFITKAAVSGGTLSAQDYSALLSMPNLEYVELAGAETEEKKIPENAMTGRNRLAFISLPKNTSVIGAGAFSNNKKLKKVSMPIMVLEIGNYAFDACEELSDIPVSENIRFIGEGAFRDCKSMTSFVIPSGILEIFPDTFSKCGFSEIYLGPALENIGDGAFADCNNLKDIYAYREAAPGLGADVFRNVGATVHVYEGSEESYAAWAANNISVNADLSGEYAPVTETQAAVSAVAVHEDESESSGDEEPEIQTSAPSDEVHEEETPQEQVQPAAGTVYPETVETSGGISDAAVIIMICVAVISASLAVIVTVIILKKKK